jgi:hypothetical protein
MGPLWVYIELARFTVQHAIWSLQHGRAHVVGVRVVTHVAVLVLYATTHSIGMTSHYRHTALHVLSLV